MSKTLKLTKFCKQVEDLFPNFYLTCYPDAKGKIASIDIHAYRDIFTDDFLKFLFENLKDYSIYFRCDKTGRPIVRIFVE